MVLLFHWLEKQHLFSQNGGLMVMNHESHRRKFEKKKHNTFFWWWKIIAEEFDGIPIRKKITKPNDQIQHIAMQSMLPTSGILALYFLRLLCQIPWKCNQPPFFIGWFPNHQYFSRGVSSSKRNHHFLKMVGDTLRINKSIHHSPPQKMDQFVSFAPPGYGWAFNRTCREARWNHFSHVS